MWALPTRDKFLEGVNIYEDKEPRDAMYSVATRWIDLNWGNPIDMASGIGVILISWNKVYYQRGEFNYSGLESMLGQYMHYFNYFRSIHIREYSVYQSRQIEYIYKLIQSPLEVTRKGAPIRAAVSTAKALHVISPNFFPLWDNAIAEYYDCDYAANGAATYTKFISIMKQFAFIVEGWGVQKSKSVLKLIDQYNYAAITKKWI